MESYLKNIGILYEEQCKKTEDLMKSQSQFDTIILSMQQKHEEDTKKIEALLKDIKLKDSRIAAYERSTNTSVSLKLAKDNLQLKSTPKEDISCRSSIEKLSEFDVPEILKPQTPPSSPRSSPPSPKSPIKDSYADFDILELDSDRYFINNDTSELHEVISINNKERPGNILGKIKTFKTKAGILYILNDHTQKVYHTNEDNEILDYCGDLINKKLKLI